VPGTNILIIAPNYSLSQISWDIQKEYYKRFNVEVEKMNAKDKVIELKNGSSVRMGSVSQADSVVGRSYDLIIFDEAALDDKGEEAFNIRLRPTLDKLNSKCIFISTPRGNNYFKKFYERGFSDEYSTWVSIRSDWKENPRLSEEDIQDAKKSMSIGAFKQEYEADFVSVEGQIFAAYNQANTRELEDINVVDVIAGLDIGYRDATAMVVVYILEDSFYIADEYEATKKSTLEHATKIKELMELHTVDFVYVDAAAAQTRHDFAMQYDITTVKGKKDVLAGLGYLTSLFEQDRIFVNPKCKNVLSMINNYRWDNREGVTREKPLHDEHSHMADALRYALFSHSHNVPVLE
jgi:phage terminase large subunit